MGTGGAETREIPNTRYYSIIVTLWSIHTDVINYKKKKKKNVILINRILCV